MKQTDDLLREACAELAEEETDALEQSLNRTAIREAEEVYRHHRPKALRLIRRYTRKRSTAVFPSGVTGETGTNCSGALKK